MITGPKGWHAGLIERRFVGTAPSSYDSSARTVDCVISAGAAVKRFYGTEILRIDERSIDLDRVHRGVAPLLDSHQSGGIANALGTIRDAWIVSGRLMGKLAFNATEAGRSAEGMVSRGEISGVSAGYQVREWEISDEDGRIIDPDSASYEDSLIFTATRWSLLECSLVSVPADGLASVRSLGGDGADHIAGARMRMETRTRMLARQQALSSGDPK
jgi:Caudovirus prohead serine protease